MRPERLYLLDILEAADGIVAQSEAVPAKSDAGFEVQNGRSQLFGLLPRGMQQVHGQPLGGLEAHAR